MKTDTYQKCPMPMKDHVSRQKFPYTAFRISVKKRFRVIMKYPGQKEFVNNMNPALCNCLCNKPLMCGLQKILLCACIYNSR